jgi:hypothetical protein
VVRVEDIVHDPKENVNAKNVKEFVTELESLGTEYKPWIEDLQK